MYYKRIIHNVCDVAYMRRVLAINKTSGLLLISKEMRPGMTKRYIQISVKDFALKKRGPMDGAGDDMNVLSVSMHYPSEDQASVERLFPFKLSEKLPSSWSNYDKSVAFKVAVRGQVKINVKVISVDKESKAEKFFKGLFTTVATATLGVETAGFGSAYAGAITKGVVGSLIDKFDDPEDDDVDKIGEGSIKFAASNTSALNKTYDVNLDVKKAVKKKVYAKNGKGNIVKGRRSRVEKVSIPKGVNGSVTLEVKEV